MTRHPDSGIAIIGLAGRFPTAADPATLWRRLVAGDDCITGCIGHSSYTDDGRWLRDGGVGIPAGFLDGYDQFDACFFGISPLEARITDPQHRLVLEAVWEALEDAGYGEPAGRRIGVFATSSQNGYLWTNVRANSGVRAATDETQLALANAPDFLAARVAFKLDLRGPALTVSAACSSSLVAVHLARQSLLAGECDLAVVAAASVTVSPWCQREPDGTPTPPKLPQRCRSFSADADHTVAADGVAAVVLRPLAAATEARDQVRAVIRGSAVNNDGGAKMGFSTPGVDGQIEVIREALAAAGVDPATVGYVEGHGSGTPIGDSIELTALAEGYGPAPDGKRLLGSTKSNLGYLDGTAGLVGLVKTVLALQHQVIPGNLHFSAPHQNMRGFTVATGTIPWPRGESPRRAGVGAYAMGGTNAHVILEAAPAAVAVAAPATGAGAARVSGATGTGRVAPRLRSHALLTVSARSQPAVDDAVARLTGYLTESAVDLDSAAFTLQVGRRAFRYRRTAVVALAEGTAGVKVDAWTPAADADACGVGVDRDAGAGVVFRFPETLPSTTAAAELERQEPAFAAAVAECVTILRDQHGRDMPLAPTVISFVTWYAMIRLWMSWGVAPAATIGPDTPAGEWRLAADAASGVTDLVTALAEALASSVDAPPGTPHTARDSGPGGHGVVLDLGACLNAPGRAAALGALWAAGVGIDWDGYHAGSRACRVPLPTYPFERERYWVDPDPPRTPWPAETAGAEHSSGGSPAGWDETIERLLADLLDRPAGTDPVVDSADTADLVDPVAAVVAAVWQEVLGVESVAASDDFFALGGDSLRLLRMTGRLRDLFGLEVPLEEAFRARRFERIIALLEDLVTREVLG